MTSYGFHPDRARTAFDGVTVVDGQGAARAVIAEAPGRLAVVVRGVPRSAVFACPCGCGDVVVVNLDRAVGPAWRLWRNGADVSLMPSVWRTSGCRSHFIVWRSRIWWCRWHDEDEDSEASTTLGDGEDWPTEMDEELRDEWRRIRAEWAARRR